jgi:hypothetical protein
MLPDKTLAIKSDETRKEGFKSIKERLTLLFCVNKTGSHKLKPLCIGKSRQPRCFHHINQKALPFLYSSSKNAWMTSDIFQDWFQNEFVPSVRKRLRSLKLPTKAVLLLDNCPAHPPAELLISRDGLIKGAYLPKNTTSLIQPLDQGIIATFKKNYRRELVSSLVTSEMPVTDFLKKMTIKDFIYNGANAWNAISSSTIEGCWMRGLSHAFDNTLDSSKDNNDDEDDALADISDVDSDEDFDGFCNDDVSKSNGRELGIFRDALLSDGIAISDEDIDLWLNYDESVPTTDILTDEEIVASVTQKGMIQFRFVALIPSIF